MEYSWSAFFFGITAGIAGAALKECISLFFTKWNARRAAQGAQAVQQENETHRARLDEAVTLRFAAIEDRLRVHQEAFTFCMRLHKAYYSGVEKKSFKTDFSEAVPSPMIHLVNHCYEWWIRNCLYLEPKSRLAFFRATFLMRQLASRSSWADTQITSAGEAITQLRAAIEDAFVLPPLVQKVEP